ncbi:SMC-Scp complex subunit ScpB [Govanella unica]|uniref:SMC-Scp complex subunit ScpB n=1 Tax=Govanella unica TaxID=2975056 RepID=A0A9X3TX45_9PROT|nr:SMC-Scp complex subunit ScpB [Govania unica]MDA5193319.1 SMC-Scp complex subunit ScpB [Govania unica]
MALHEYLRTVEALLFASAAPLSEHDLQSRLPEDVDAGALLQELQAHYAPRGVNLVEVGGKWLFRTAPDLAFLLRKEVEEPRKLSRAAVETLAIIAYQQPVTRAEIEDIRGVSLSKGTVDVLMEAGWVRPRGRRKVPGRPLMYGTTEDFLVHFGLETVKDLPGIEELRAAGLLDHVNLGVLDLQSTEDDTEDEEPVFPGFEPEDDAETGDEDQDADSAEDQTSGETGH